MSCSRDGFRCQLRANLFLFKNVLNHNFMDFLFSQCMFFIWRMSNYFLHRWCVIPGIQEYLNENGRSVNLFGNPEFNRFAKALDTVLADFQPRISPEGLLICRIEEEHLWEAQQLGSQTPHVSVRRVEKTYLMFDYFMRSCNAVPEFMSH